MSCYHLKKNPSLCPTVNLDKLPTLVREQTWVNIAKSKTVVLPSLMWCVLGCYKVLGKEKLPRQPVTVKVKVSSQRTEEKMKGVCVFVHVRVGGGGDVSVLVA